MSNIIESIKTVFSGSVEDGSLEAKIEARIDKKITFDDAYNKAVTQIKEQAVGEHLVELLLGKEVVDATNAAIADVGRLATEQNIKKHPKAFFSPEPGTMFGSNIFTTIPLMVLSVHSIIKVLARSIDVEK